MKLNIEHRTILAILAFLLAGAGIVVGVIVPAVRDIRSYSQETDDLRQYLEKKYERAVRVRESLQRVREIKLAAAGYRSHIFHSGQEVVLITTLETVAATSGVTEKIVNSSFENNPARHLILTVNATGDFTRIARYLAGLENTPYFITVKNLQLTAGADPVTRRPQVTLNADLSIYVAP